MQTWLLYWKAGCVEESTGSCEGGGRRAKGRGTLTMPPRVKFKVRQSMKLTTTTHSRTSVYCSPLPRLLSPWQSPEYPRGHKCSSVFPAVVPSPPQSSPAGCCSATSMSDPAVTPVGPYRRASQSHEYPGRRGGRGNGAIVSASPTQMRRKGMR